VNLILERSDRIRFYTDMRVVLEAAGLRASAFDWYLSDVETNYYGPDFSNDDRWVSGIELEAFLNVHSVQFIWAVFSAFPVGYRREVAEAPYVDDNPLYWQGLEVSPQLSDALFEIVCWDSSATILIGLPNEAERRFADVYPETRSLTAASQNRHA
jgi:hypothetical protein